MVKYVMITTTFTDKKELDNIINILLTEKLVSCCQVSEIHSTYHWKNSIEQEKEYLLQMKTKKLLYPEIEKKIISLHSYETPQLVMYDIIDGYKPYLDWINQETK